jgi:hypothetical protein
MKSLFPSIRPLAAVLIISALTGCANMPGSQHMQHHPQSSPSQAPGPMSSGMSGGQSGMMMDRQAMCDMHEKMMSAKTPEERRAMMNERMKDMSPEMMQKQMEMMQEQCKR